MDQFIFRKINRLAGRYECLDFFASFCAQYLGYLLVMILFIYFLKDRKKYKVILLRSLAAAVFSRFIIAETIRLFWERSRPFVDNAVNLLFEHSASPSFPSGHAAFFFGFSFTVYLHDKKTGSIFLVASFLVSIARVYGGVHWPSDILVGAAIGIASAYLINKLSPKIKFLN